LSSSAPILRNALVALALGGAIALSCTFSPGPAGSTGSSSTGSPTGGLLGGAGSTGSGTGTGIGASSGTGTGTGTGGSTKPPPSADGPNCGLQQYGLQNVPPDLLIIQDKSGSMADDESDNPCGGRNAPAMCVSKWTDITTGINMVVAQTDTTIRWGLKFFANDNGCGVNAGAAVPIGPGSGPAIAAAIMATRPGGSTPTAAAVTSGATYLMGLTDPNPKYILLATDGEPNCGAMAAKTSDDDSTGAEAAVMMAAMAGIPVFVVGVGNVASAVMTLDQLAVNGGRPQATEPRYYPVASTADLVAVLKTIGGQITSCTFSLGKAPPDPANIAVNAINAAGTSTRLTQSMTNGWAYGAGMTSIELFGAACDNVKSKATTDVQAIFGCPGMVIP
jgi:hypothetical protein